MYKVKKLLPFGWNVKLAQNSQQLNAISEFTEYLCKYNAYMYNDIR